jgi:hypothetical protein
LGHALSKRFARYIQGQKCVTIIGLKGRQIISLPGAPTPLGLALISMIFQGEQVAFASELLLPKFLLFF